MRLLGEVVYDYDSADLNCAQRGDLTFAVFLERYLREHHGAEPGAVPVGSRDRYLDRRLLQTHIPPASGAAAREYYQLEGARVHRNLTATPIANRVPGFVAAMFTLTERRALLAGRRQPPPQPPPTHENFGEGLGAMEAASAPIAAVASIRLLILSGARKDEILGLQWRAGSFGRFRIRKPIPTLFISTPRPRGQLRRIADRQYEKAGTACARPQASTTPSSRICNIFRHGRRERRVLAVVARPRGKPRQRGVMHTLAMTRSVKRMR